MRALWMVALALAGCGGDRGEADREPFAGDETAEIVPAREAVATADVARTDPEMMDEAEIAAALPPGPQCRFAYTDAETPSSGPVLAAADGAAVIKLHGELVRLQPAERGFGALTDGGAFAAPGLRLAVAPAPDAEPETEGAWRSVRADLRLEIEQGLSSGWRGFYRCRVSAVRGRG